MAGLFKALAIFPCPDIAFFMSVCETSDLTLLFERHAQWTRGMLSVLDFYLESFSEYHQQTFHIDPSSFLKPLFHCIPEKSKILDVGCGSGRDLLWLTERGHEGMGFERSFGLAAIAAEKTGRPLIVGDFETFDFSRFSMDALLLVGALVHVPPYRLQGVLHNVLAAVRPGGHVLLTLKEGSGVRVARDGRVFYLWRHESFSRLFSPCGLRLLEFFRQASSLKNGDVWLTYVLKTSE